MEELFSVELSCIEPETLAIQLQNNLCEEDGRVLEEKTVVLSLEKNKKKKIYIYIYIYIYMMTKSCIVKLNSALNN